MLDPTGVCSMVTSFTKYGSCSSTQFAAATVMRHVLLDWAKSHKRVKRGGDNVCVKLTESSALAWSDPETVIEVDRVLTKLAAFDERKARVVEMIFTVVDLRRGGRSASALRSDGSPRAQDGQGLDVQHSATPCRFSPKRRNVTLWSRVQQIVSAAAEMELATRRAWVQSTCGSDTALREQVKTCSLRTRGRATSSFLTHPAEHVLTPEYASPEQLCGETITTANDVYGWA